MASPNREQLLNMAIQSAKQGNKQGARVMFQQVLKQDPKNERALMWMAKTSTTAAEREKWLRRVLKVNPENETAKKVLNKITSKVEASESTRMLYFGAIAAAAFMVLTVLVAFLWAIAPLS